MVDSSLEANKEIVRRVFREVFEQGRLETADSLIDEGFINHDAPAQEPGPSGVKSVATAFRTGLADLHPEIVELVAEGDRVVASTVIRGLHRGPLFGVTPSHRPVSLRVIDIFRVANGRIVERSGIFDLQGLRTSEA